MRNISYIEDYETWKSEFSFFTKIPIRFSETDMFGHVNNVSAFIYFEQARIEFMREVDLYNDEMAKTSMPVVSDLQCNYLKQLYFGETLKLYVKANSIGNTSVDIHYLGVNETGKNCLVGRGRMVNVDLKSGTPIPFTEQVRQKLQQNK